ncbi:MAG: hypothetical protein AB7W16_13185 [Candidatus Obscuribacterales bacterium]
MKKKGSAKKNGKLVLDDSHDRYVTARLDQALPLVTEDWMTVEQILNRLSEFAPADMLMELTNAIAVYADDQARRGYILGQDDIFKEMARRQAA